MVEIMRNIFLFEFVKNFKNLINDNNKVLVLYLGIFML